MLKRRGDLVRRGEAFAIVHAASADETLAARAAACFEITAAPPASHAADLVIERIA
jgi:hypothetical protein